MLIFIQPAQFCILKLKSFIALLKGWAILFNVCINSHKWLVEAFYWLSFNGSHCVPLLVLGHCLPSIPPLAIYWVVSTLPWCLVFSLSHDQNSICHGVITCLGPGCACSKENLWLYQSDLNYYRDTYKVGFDRKIAVIYFNFNMQVNLTLVP